jgi:hypothetical protein
MPAGRSHSISIARFFLVIPLFQIYLSYLIYSKCKKIKEALLAV